MPDNPQILKHVNLIRRGAASVGRLPFAGDAMIEACRSIESAGMPFHYRLSETAREYAFLQNSEHVTVVLAARVGNPRIPPTPPLWPLLALLLLGWRDTVSGEGIMERAAGLRAQDEVQRGLAIVAHLVPELQGWLERLPLSIPRWERALAVPLAARKLARVENMEGLESGKETGRSARWCVTGGSRRGASHVAAGLRNQDAIRYTVSANGDTVVLAVADGHGSGLSFRSHIGSRLAVETAVELLQQFAGTIRRGASAAALEDRARTVLAEEFVQCWRAAVERDIESRPFTDDEWANLAALEGWKGQAAIRHHPVRAYGSTILAVLATQGYVLCVQLGDGDILFVDSQGQSHRGIPSDLPAARHRTASLGRQNPTGQFRIVAQDGSAELPTLILAATDGYADSYRSKNECLKLGREYLWTIRKEGFDGVERRLTRFLDELASAGSGDDTTIGLIWASR